MALSRGDRVKYRSIAGPVYDAVVVAVEPAGFVSLDVDIGGKEPWPIKAVRVERVEPCSSSSQT